MPNAHRGATSAPGLGELRYDWDAIARLVDVFGNDFDAKITAAALATDLDTIAKAAAIGCGKTAEQVKALSPTITPTVQAIMAALNLAFTGKREAPPVAGENPPNRNSGAISSPTRAKRRSGRA